MHQNLHLVVPDVPIPANAHSSRDIFFRVKALHAAGIGIHLHCFDSGQHEANMYEPFCRSIRYYEKYQTNGLLHLQSIPHSVASRANMALAENLFADEYPILYEGLSTTFPALLKVHHKEKKQFINSRYDESHHQKSLASLTPWGFKKISHQVESWKFELYAKKIRANQQINWIQAPEFNGDPDFSFSEKMGSFCLFYGQLSERETEYAAYWLLENIFNELELPFVIAGNGPSTQLEQAAHLRLHTCLVADPGSKELDELVKKAQIVMIPSFIENGQTNNLVHALSYGKHVLTNPKSLGNSALATWCSVAETPEQFKEKTASLFKQIYTEEEHNSRKNTLISLFNDTAHAEALIRMLNLHGL
jgi:Glycosyl transferases group 1